MHSDDIRSLIDAVPLPAVLIGTDERIAAANRRAAALLGSGLEGRHFITVLRQPTVLDAIEASLRDGAPRTIRYLSREGAQDTTYAVSCALVGAAAGAGLLVCFEDITHVEQAGQMRRDFVANVSHELRSPLTALLGFIETLRGPARGDDAAIDRFLGTMQFEAERMERLVRDLLSLSRVEGEERQRPTDPVDLAGMVTAVVNTLRPLADDSRVTLRSDLPGDRLLVPGDGDQLRQVCINLVENAIKYGGPGKSVHVRLATADHEPALRGPAVVLAVRDEGPGIDPVHIPRLTERFYRVDSHRSREMGGTGLGLAIVKHIVGRHRGRLRIDSTPGRGSEFRVMLPRESRA